jgi:hypothetical protein
MSMAPATSRRALQSEIRRVARVEKRLLLVHGIASFAALVLGMILLAGLADYLLRLRDPGLRWGLTGLVLVVGGSAFRRRVWPVLRYHRSDVSTAQRIERFFPEMGDRLSNAVAFLETARPETTAGSSALRHVVVEQAWADARRLPLRTSLAPAVSRRALARLAVMVAIAVGVSLLDPATSRLAAQRLAFPWGDLPWPRRHVLEFVDPPRYLGPGQDFEATVIDRRGDPPDLVTIQLWFEGDDASQIQHRAMRFAGGRLVHRLSNVQRSFRYRAVGGDDDTMDWIELSLVEPPQLASVQVRVTPPDYLGAIPYDAVGPVTAVAGSQLAWHGRAAQPLSEIRLHVDPIDALAGEPTPPWSAELASDSETFHWPAARQPGWPLEQSGSYWFELVDIERRAFSLDPCELRMRVDQPPSIRLLPLSRDGMVTPQAELELTIVAEDDFALKSLELRISRSGGEDLVVPVWTRAEPPSGVTLMPPPPVDLQRVVHTLDLAPFGLQAGELLDVVAVGSDYLPQAGTSSEQRLRIVSREEFEQRFAQQQSELAAQILESVRLQQASKSQAESVRSELERSGQVERADLERLQSAELNQRRVPQLVSEDNRSILSRVREARQELERNRLERPDVAERLEWLEGELRKLAGEDLPAIQRDLLEAIKLAPPDLASPQPVPETQAATLRSAVERQQQTLERLESIAQQLGEWESYRRFAQEAQQLWQEQQQLREQTEALQPKTVGRELRELASAERAALKRLEQQQGDLTRRWEHLLERLGNKESALAESEPELAENLAAGAELARRRNVSGTLRDAAQRLEQNRLGQAIEEQRTAAEGLEQVSRALAGRDPPSAEDSGNRQRRQAEQRAQEELRQRLREFFSTVEALEVRQGELQAETRDTAEQVGDEATEAARSSGRQLGEQQQRLAVETEVLQPLIQHSLLFTWQLERIVSEMNGATTALDGLAWDAAGGHQESARRRLRELLQSLEPLTQRDPQEPPSTDEPPDEEEADDESGSGPRLGLEELRLLRVMQNELFQETRQLAERIARGDTDDVADLEVVRLRLASEQERLARLLIALMGGASDEHDGKDAGEPARPGSTRPAETPRGEKQRQQQLLDDLDQQLLPR